MDSRNCQQTSVTAILASIGRFEGIGSDRQKLRLVTISLPFGDGVVELSGIVLVFVELVERREVRFGERRVFVTVFFVLCGVLGVGRGDGWEYVDGGSSSFWS